jgi:hypothetical protein
MTIYSLSTWESIINLGGSRGRDRMVVGFITTYAISSNPAPEDEVYSLQHYVIKFVSDLPQIGCLLRVLRFLPPIKLTATK